MNDLEELRFGMLQGVQQFPIYAQAAACTPSRAKILLDTFSHYVGYMSENTLVDTYILCLCEHAPDDKDGVLSMWRSYASQGHGIALVFNTRNIPDPPQAPLGIAKVIYGAGRPLIRIIDTRCRNTPSQRFADVITQIYDAIFEEGEAL